MKNKKIQFKKSNSGFSVLELLVAVAVVGILAAIGIGNYAKTQARTRQTEAKASLATLYVAEISFFGEYSQFTTDLKNLGFGVFGSKLRYMTGFYPNVGCTGYDSSQDAPPEVNTLTNSWSCGANVNPITNDQAKNWILPTSIIMVDDICTTSPAALPGTTSFCDTTVGNQSFDAVAIGNPNRDPGPQPIDGWTISHNKKLSNTTSGLD